MKGYTKICVYLAGQSPWCLDPVRPPLCVYRCARCKNHLGACWAAGWVDCDKGRVPYGGEASGLGLGTWGPAGPEPGAGPEAGGAGAWVDRAGIAWLWVEAEPGLGRAAGGQQGSWADGSCQAPGPYVCSSLAGLWSVCLAHLSRKKPRLTMWFYFQRCIFQMAPLHLTEQFFLTWVSHAAADGWKVLALPLLHLFLHLVNFGWVQCPQTALAWRAARLVLHFLKAFVQGQVVPDWVLPSIRCSLLEEEWHGIGQTYHLNGTTLFILFF